MIAVDAEQTIEVTEARARERGGEAVLVDVREGYERQDPPVRDALVAPLFDIITGAAVLPHDRTLIVMDRDGSRALFGARLLEDRGHRAVALEGGALAYAASSD